MAKRYKGWVVRWDWAGDHARVDKALITLLSPRMTSGQLAQFIERYYASQTYEPDELLSFMVHPEKNPYRAQEATLEVTYEDGSPGRCGWDGEVMCGANPWIEARRTVIWYDSSSATVAWEDVPRPVIDFRKRRPSGERSTEGVQKRP